MTNITPSVNSRIGILGTENWDIRDRKINDNNEDNQIIYLDLPKLETRLRNLSILIHKHK